MLRKTNDAPGIQVFIMTVNIGVGVVKYIVLYFSVVHITGQDINAGSHKLVQPWLGRVRTVVTVVHHVHSNSGHSHTNDNGKQ